MGSQAQAISIQISLGFGGWKVDATEIEAMLSLWLSSANEEESRQYEPSNEYDLYISPRPIGGKGLMAALERDDGKTELADLGGAHTKPRTRSPMVDSKRSTRNISQASRGYWLAVREPMRA
jgi:hypothetical protein